MRLLSDLALLSSSLLAAIRLLNYNAIRFLRCRAPRRKPLKLVELYREQ